MSIRNYCIFLRCWSPYIFLLLLLFVAFFRIVFLGETFSAAPFIAGVTPAGAYGYNGNRDVDLYTFGGDPGGSGWQIVAGQEKVLKELIRGRAPLWNPNEMFGTPLAHNMQLSPFFPLKFILFFSRSPAMEDAYKLILFLLAGVFTYLYLQLIGLQKASSLIGAVCFMLTGFLVMYAPFSFMDAQIMLPVLLYVIERWIRRNTLQNLSFVAVSLGFTFICGYPEPVFLSVVFAVTYAAYRGAEIWWKTSGHFRIAARSTAYFTAALVLGAGFAAVMLVPGIHVLLQTENTRPPGIGMSTSALKFLYASFMPYVLAFLKPRYYELWCGWHGFLPGILALVAICRRPRPIVFFFVILSIGGYMQLGGIPPVRWIAYLPFFNRVIYVRYLHPEIAISVAILAAFGADRWLNREMSLKNFIIIVICLLTVCASLLFTQKHLFARWTIDHSAISLLALPVVLTILLVILSFCHLHNHMRAGLAGTFLLLLVSAEMASYTQHRRNIRYNPFTPAPYIHFLNTQPSLKDHQARILGLNGILYPPYSNAFDFDDIRWMNAVYYPYYSTYIKQFICPSAVDRLVGDEKDFNLFGQNGHLSPFLNLANIKYLLTSDSLYKIQSGNLEQEIIDRGTVWTPASPKLQQVQNGAKRFAALNLPVPSLIRFPVRVRDNVAGLGALMTVRQAVTGGDWDSTLNFSLSIGQTGPFSILFNADVNPHANISDRMWLNKTIDLSKFRGKRILLRLETLPNNTNAFDHTFWSDLRLGSKPLPVEKLFRVVSTNPPALPAVIELTIRGNKKAAISAHAPTVMEGIVDVPFDRTDLSLSYGLAETGWKGSVDGAQFVVSAGIYQEKGLLHRRTNVGGKVHSEKWYPVKVDLTRYRGEKIDLILKAQLTNGAARSDGLQMILGDIHLVHSGPPPLKEIYNNDIKVFENPDALSRAFVVHNYKVVQDDREAVEAMKSPQFNPSKTVILTRSDSLGSLPPIVQRPPIMTSYAQIVYYLPDRVEVQTTTQGPGILVLSDAFSPDWHAFIDEKEAPIHRADLAFRAVVLPSGVHTVIFQYNKSLFYVSLMVTLISLLLIVLLASCKIKHSSYAGSAL